jgi:hypothetical protein
VARIRSIHPDICIDKGLAQMDNARAERTFMRLWTHCDDDGRCIDDERLLKAALFPRLDSMGTPEVAEDIDRLEKFGFVVRYEVDDERYLHIPSFSVWQKPNRKVDSKLPAPVVVEGDVESSYNSVSAQRGAPPVVVEGDVVVVGDGGGADASVAPSKASRAVRIPADFEVTDDMREWAIGKGIRSPVDSETEKFRDHFTANGKPAKDWVAAWRNWMRKADEWSSQRRPAQQSRTDFMMGVLADDFAK